MPVHARSARHRIGATLAALAALAGCAVVSGLDGDRRVADAPAAPAGHGGAGGTSGAGGAADAGPAIDAADDAASGACVLATYPAPPAAPTAPGDVEIVVALRTVDLGDGGSVVGLDLDAKCTCGGDGPSCKRPPWVDQELCDSAGGRDAQSAKLFTLLSPATGGDVGSARFTVGLQGGTWSMLVRVRGYNGKPNDDRVQLALFPSAGLPIAQRPPRWDGSDAWPIADTAVVEGSDSLEAPRFVDENAYVSGGKLVASVGVSEMYIAGSQAYMPLRLTAAFLVATVQAKGGSFELIDGQLAARWKLVDMFEFVHAMRLKSGPLCKDAAIYPMLKGRLCASLDIYSSLTTPTTECDSMSLGLGFTASRAMLGALAPLPDPSPGCPPPTDPLGDVCP